MNPTNKFKIKIIAFIQTYSLIAAMTALTSFIAYITAGKLFAVSCIFLILMIYILTPSATPEALFKFFRAKKINYLDAPVLHKTINYLSKKAGLPAPPELYYILSEKPAAFATGTTEKSIIAVSSGLLASLTPDELAGVLGHEITHIANNDMRIMWAVVVLNRVTGFLSILGQVLVFINLPLILLGGMSINWLLVALLVFAPTLAFIIQLTLSRVREYSADRGSAELLGTPDPLISALAKIEYCPRSFWGNFVYKKQKINTASLFMTHPPTEERIKRLISLRGRKKVGGKNIFTIHHPKNCIRLSMF